MSNSLPKQKKSVSISEAAKILGVSIDTIRRWDKSGVLHSDRPDGKNRYFSPEELEEHKLNRPLSISEVARKLNVSATTLRRLEMRGLIKPGRNNAGERVFDKDQIENFLKSDYFLRKGKIKKKVPESNQKEKAVPEMEILANQPDPGQNQNLQIRSYVRSYVTIAIALFILLVSVSTGKMVLSKTKTIPPLPSHVALSQTKEPEPEKKLKEVAGTKVEATSEASPGAIRLVQINSDSFEINIRQEPTTNSKILGKAKDGETFEFVSQVPGWYEVKLLNGSKGYISDTYTAIKEIN